MKISQNVLKLLNEKNKTQKELSAYIGVATSTINNWIKFNRSIPSESIIPICEFFEISPYMLLTGEEKAVQMTLSEDEQELLSFYKPLPYKIKQQLIGRAELLYEQSLDQEKPEIIPKLPIYYIEDSVSAGLGEILSDYETCKTVYVEDTPESRKADFILHISGDSMEPKFRDGDLVLVRQQQTIDIGQIGIFIQDGCGYIKKKGAESLISLNSNYPDIDLNESCRCFGIVLGTTEIMEY